MTKRSDELLLEKARDGDKAAFEEFYQRHKRQLFVYIYRLVNGYELAEELTQETFVNAYTHLDSYRSQGKSLGWVYTIAGNLAKNALRSKIIRAEISLDAPLAGTDGNLNMLDVLEDLKERPEIIIRSKELVSNMQEALQMLPVEEREILLLCDMQGCSYQEVAQILGFKPATIGTKLFRARRKIAKKLSSIYKEKPRKWFRWKEANVLRKDFRSS